MVTKGRDIKSARLRTKYVTEIPGSKWRAMKKSGTYEESFNKFIYVKEGATDSNGFVGFQWDSSLLEPSVFPVIWKKGGYIDPNPNLFITMYDKFPNEVVFRVFAFGTATISGNSVLRDTIIPVQNVWVKALMFHAERTT